MPSGPSSTISLTGPGPQAIRAAPRAASRAAASRTRGAANRPARTSAAQRSQLAPRARRGVGDGGHAGRAQARAPPRRVPSAITVGGSGPTARRDRGLLRRTRGRSGARRGARRPPRAESREPAPCSAPTHAGCGDAGAPGRAGATASSSTAVGKRPRAASSSASPRTQPPRGSRLRTRRGSSPSKAGTRRKAAAVEVRIAGRERRRGAGADRRRPAARWRRDSRCDVRGPPASRRSTRASSEPDDASTAHGHARPRAAAPGRRSRPARPRGSRSSRVSPTTGAASLP